MADRWTAKEHNTLIEMLVDGVSIQSIVDAIPSKSEGAIVTRARNKKLGLNYRTSRVDGKLYKGVSRRQRTKAKLDAILAEKEVIVGEPRVATTTQEPTTSETISTESIGSIPNPETQINEGLKAYTDAVSILQDNNLPVDHNFVCIFSTFILSAKDSA